MADDESVAASSGDAAVLNTLGLVGEVPKWGAAKYIARYRQLLDLRRFARMFLVDRGKSMIDCRGMRHDTDTGA